MNDDKQYPLNVESQIVKKDFISKVANEIFIAAKLENCKNCADYKCRIRRILKLKVFCYMCQ